MKADTVVSGVCDTSGSIVLLPCPPTVLLPAQPVPLFVWLPPSAYAIPDVTSSTFVSVRVIITIIIITAATATATTKTLPPYDNQSRKF